MARLRAGALLLLFACLPLTTISAGQTDNAAASSVQLGPRPYYLVDSMRDGPLKSRLQACSSGPFSPRRFSIGHRGAPLQFPEHTRESYLAAARMGAGALECDVTFTKDRALVCRHSQCDLHTTTNILSVPELAAKCSQPFQPAEFDESAALVKPATARCCTTDITLSEYRSLRGKMDASDVTARTPEAFLGGTPDWRTDLYSGAMGGRLMTHRESIELFKALDVAMTPELKAPMVEMPFDGFSREAYAQKLIDEYKSEGVAPARLRLQTFHIEDLRYWLDHEPEFARSAVLLDGRKNSPEYNPDEADAWNPESPYWLTHEPEYGRVMAMLEAQDKATVFDPAHPLSWNPSMEMLVRHGVRSLAPPLWMLLTLGPGGQIVPSVYANKAREAGLELLAWSLERSGHLADGDDFYYRLIDPLLKARRSEGIVFELLDVLVRQVGVTAVFSDWPATETYYANCMNID